MVSTRWYYCNQHLVRVADLSSSRQAMLGTYRPHSVVTSHSTTHAVVAVTHSLVAALNPVELEGRRAHKISQRENHSRMLIAYASLLVVVATFILQIGMSTGFALSSWM